MKPPNNKKNIIIFVLALAFVLAVCGTSAAANEQNTTYNTNDNQVLPDPTVIRGGTEISNHTTIQGAINAAQSGDTIRLEYGATFNLTSTLTIGKSLTFDVWNAGRTGPGGTAIISGQSGTNYVRIASITSNSINVIFNNITFVNGRTTGNGGAINNGNSGSTITLNKCNFTNNSATGATSTGGAIRTTGTLTATDCAFSGNTATVNGGAIYSTGTLTTTNSNFTNNNATGNNHNGGAIYSTGTLTATNSNFTNNNAGVYGGAIYNQGSLNLSGSTFSGNTAYDGGAVSFGTTGTVPAGTLTVTNCTFSSNIATSAGGGIWSHGTSTVSNSTFTNNIANTSGTYGTPKGCGAAIRNWGTLTVTGSTFIGNVATTSGGAISNYQGTTTARFNRFISNGSNDIRAENNGGASSVNAENNWWGTNFVGTNPVSAGRITAATGATVDADPWFVLRINATPNSIHTGETSTVTADLTWNSNNVQPTGGQLPNGMTVAFGGNLGTLNPTSSNIITTAASTFTAGSVPGIATVNATVDSQTVNTTINIDSKAALVINQTVNGANTGTLNLNVGDKVTYLVTVTNNGPNAATEINISDIVPSGLSGVTVTGGTYDSGTGIWYIPSLANGASTTLNITGTIGSALAGQTFNNTVNQINQTEYTPELASSTSIPVYVKKADLTITNTANSSTLNVGQTGTFTITVTNNGPDDATNININDILPPGFTAGTPSTGTYDGTTWNIPSLASGNSTTLTFTGTITPAMAGTNITNSGNATLNEYPQNITLTNATIYVKKADVALSQTVNGGTSAIVNVGDVVNFIITAINYGPDIAHNINISDIVPAGLTNVIITASDGTTYSGGVWTISNLDTGLLNAVTLNITGIAGSSMAGTTTTNTATRTSQDEYNSLPAVSAADVYTKKADLTITNTANSSTLNVGQTGTFTITVTNNGPDDATNININDILPPGFTAGTPSTGTYDGTTWNIPSLASGNSTTLTFTGTITPAMAGTNITNSGNATLNEYPQNITLTNATIQINPMAEVTLSQTVNGASTGTLNLNVGDKVTFIVTATNNGPNTATEINIRDIVPAGLTGVTIIPSIGTYDPITGIWYIPSLTNGTIATLNITGTIGSTYSGQTFNNTATQINQTEYTPQLANSTSIPVHVFKTNVNLFVTNYPWQSGVYTYDYRQQIVFLAQVNNLGETTATGIVAKYIIGNAFKVISYNLIQPGTLEFNTTTNTFTWMIDQLAGGNNTYSGSYASFSVLLESLKTGSGGADFRLNSTIISSDQNNTGTTTTRVRNLIIRPSADIQVSQTVNNLTPQNGDYITITIKAKNNGPNTSTGLNITDILPAGLYLDPLADPNTSITASQGTYNTTTGIWNIGTLTNSTEATLNLTVKVIAATGTTISNFAYRSGTPAQYDWNTANDAYNLVINVANTDVNLFVTNYPWYSGVYTYDYKQQIVMLAQVNNLGNTTATGIVVKYIIGNAFKVISYNLIQPGTLEFNSTTNTFTWMIDQLEGGNNTYSGSYASFSVLLESLKTGSGGADFRLNSTIISSDQNNTGTTKTRIRNIIIRPSADIQVEQTVSNNNPQNGDYITITIKAKNNGPNTSTGLNITDILPAGLYLDPLADPNTSITTTQGTYNTTTGIWNIGTLTNNTEATLTLTVKVTGTNGTQLANYAFRSGTPEQYDWTTGNDSKEVNLLIKE